MYTVGFTCRYITRNKGGRATHPGLEISGPDRPLDLQPRPLPDTTPFRLVFPVIGW